MDGFPICYTLQNKAFFSLMMYVIRRLIFYFVTPGPFATSTARYLNFGNQCDHGIKRFWQLASPRFLLFSALLSIKSFGALGIDL